MTAVALVAVVLLWVASLVVVVRRPGLVTRGRGDHRAVGSASWRRPREVVEWERAERSARQEEHRQKRAQAKMQRRINRDRLRRAELADAGMSDAAFLTLVSVGVVALIVVPFLIWWFAGAALTGRQYHNDTQNQQYQAGLISAERDRVQAYDTALDPGQKTQIGATFCAVYMDLNPAPSDLVAAYSRICA